MINQQGAFVMGSYTVQSMLKECDVKERTIDETLQKVTSVCVHQKTGNRCVLVEQLKDTQDHTTYHIEILGEEIAWTTPIQTKIRYNVQENTRFWTAWADEPYVREQEAKVDTAAMVNGDNVEDTDAVSNWNDPLVEVPFLNRLFYYGAPYYTPEDHHIGYVPFRKDIYCISMCSVIESDHGLSFINDVNDRCLDETMEVKASGDIIFSRIHHRICSSNSLAFNMHIVKHENSWRGGMRWVTQQFSDYFNSPVKHAGDIVGCGAYSSNENNLDVEKMQKMGFKVNWKASFDFPYLGMYIPDAEKWIGFKNQETGVDNLQNYSKNMQENGFYVLNYFNVTEFGHQVQYPFKEVNPEEICWDDSSKYISQNFKEAVLYAHKDDVPFEKSGIKVTPNAPIYTWRDAIVLDPTDESYQSFLLKQARKHVDLLPASSGIAIDRMDWLRLYNFNKDDGMSFVNGQKTSSLYFGWHQVMEGLAAIFHEKGKVIYCNNHLKRLDLLKNADGLFDEFTYAGPSLNTTAILGANMAVIGWVSDNRYAREKTDDLIQRFLYMGVLPVAPIEGNDHSLRPHEGIEEKYMDYAPMFELMVQKSWVFQGDYGKIVTGHGKMNMFKVATGYVVMIIEGSEDIEVVLKDNFYGPEIEAIMPGGMKEQLSVEKDEAYFRVKTKTERGCVMLHIKK